jgi:hypothetical protein
MGTFAKSSMTTTRIVIIKATKGTVFGTTTFLMVTVAPGHFRRTLNDFLFCVLMVVGCLTYSVVGEGDIVGRSF